MEVKRLEFSIIFLVSNMLLGKNKEKSLRRRPKHLMTILVDFSLIPPSCEKNEEQCHCRAVICQEFS